MATNGSLVEEKLTVQTFIGPYEPNKATVSPGKSQIDTSTLTNSISRKLFFSIGRTYLSL